MSNTKTNDQQFQLALPELIDAIRAKFRTRIAELEDDHIMQVSALEMALKNTSARCGDLESQVTELRSLLHNAHVRLEAATTPAVVVTPDADDDDTPPPLQSPAPE